MARINYSSGRGGSPMAWIVGLLFAAVVTVGVIALARMGAERLCDGSCAALSDLNGFLTQPFPVMGDTLIWAMGLAIVLGFILWMAFGTGSFGLAVLVVLALGVIGASLAGDEEGELLPEPEEIIESESEPETVPAPEPEPVPEDLELAVAEPAIPQCPDGNFWNGEGCSTCMVTRTVVSLPQLTLAPAPITANWGYAAADSFDLPTGSGAQPLTDFSVHTRTSAGGQPICEFDAALVIGSASSDGPLERNLDRAKARASALSNHVSNVCAGNIEVFAISFGQSIAERDNFKDRAMTIIGISTTDGAAVTPELIEAELGHVLEDGQHSAPLLDRATYFPRQDWSWVEGGAGRVNATPIARAVETISELRPGAPASCSAL